MNRALRWLLQALLASSVTATALAQPAAPATPTISVRVTDSVHVTVDAQLQGQFCATNEALASACATNQCPKNDPRTLVADESSNLYEIQGRSTPAWLTHALSGQSLFCAAAVAAPPPVVTKVDLNVTAMAATVNIVEGIDPVGSAPGSLTWGGWQDARFASLWQAVGAPVPADTCQITQASGTLACHVTLAPSPFPGSQIVSLSYSGNPVEGGAVDFKINGHAFHASIHACQLKATTALPGTLFAGANLQALELSTGLACIRRIPPQTLVLRKDDIRLAAAVEVHADQQLVELTLTNVPKPIVGGVWHLEDLGERRLGDVVLRASQAPISVRGDGKPELGVSYDLHAYATDLDHLHDGKSRDGMAVVNGTQHDYYEYIQNTAALLIDPDLLALANQLRKPAWQPPNATRLPAAPDCSSKATTCDDLDAKYNKEHECGEPSPDEDAQIDECHRRRRPWQVKAHTWESDVWINEDAWWRNSEPSFHDELGGITFAVFRPRPDPFEVMVELVRYDESARTEKVVFRQYVKLAEGARFESLPLPLASALYVECGHHRPPYKRTLFRSVVPPRSDNSADIVLNGYTRAVEDADVLSGNCRLHYSPEMLATSLKLEGAKNAIDLLNYYGSQELTVTVRRGEAEEAFPFRIEPAVEKEIELKVPRDAKNSTGIYVVSAVLKGPSLPAVAWRTPQTGTTPPTDGLADLAFRANLRPRGPFGWRIAPLRVFVTLPVSFTGVRFPARPSELSGSSSSSNVQVTKIQGGALLALEPWNYNTGRNPWPVPTRFVTGMNLYQISEGKFAPSWITGVSLTLPIIDLQKGITEDQLGTDVALGFFWESDVSERDWLKQGNHFLITFGVNLLTLFGSK